MLAGSQLNPMAKISTLESLFLFFQTFLFVFYYIMQML